MAVKRLNYNELTNNKSLNNSISYKNMENGKLKNEEEDLKDWNQLILKLIDEK